MRSAKTASEREEEVQNPFTSRELAGLESGDLDDTCLDGISSGQSIEMESLMP